MQLQNPHLEGGSFYLKGGPLGILLVHGLTATTAEVRPLAEWLHRLGYSVAGPLLPGHYTQPADLNRVHWQDWAQAVEQAYLRLKDDCQRIAAGGESTGALLALNLAGTHPEVEALLLYAPALKLAGSRIGAWRIRLLAPFVQWAPKKGLVSDMPWQGYTVNPLKGVIQLLNLQAHIRPRLSALRQPALIVQGCLDTTVDAGVPGVLINTLGSQVKELHWMEASTHCVILDRENEHVFQLTKTFLARIWSSSYAG